LDYAIIIQARLNSSRLPKKVLTKINGTPLLGYLTERLLCFFDKSKILIATSELKGDDDIVSFCKKQKINTFRGSLDDVSKRLIDAANFLKAKSFVRINADSPLLDPLIINKALDLYSNGEYDLVTNVFPRSYPIGQSVEIIKTKEFEKTYSLMCNDHHFEHVTSYFYENPSSFKIKNFQKNKNLSHFKFAVDTNEDFKKFHKIIAKMDKPHINYDLNDLIKLHD